jgi:hypothetical protein
MASSRAQGNAVNCGSEPAREGLSTTKILEPEMQKAPSQGQGFQLQLETNI